MRSLAPVALVVLAALAALARFVAAAPPEVKSTRVTGPLPDGVQGSGESPTASYTFDDKNGTNYVLFSWKQVYDRDPAREQSPPQTRYLWVDHWAVPAGGKARLVRAVKDHVDGCDADVTLAFHDDAFGVTDLDGDGFAEITFAYELGCRSDVSPDDYKLLLLENGDKYILRGKTVIDAHDRAHPTAGGGFDPDPATKKWPPAFYARATKLWAATDRDRVNPPRGPNGDE